MKVGWNCDRHRLSFGVAGRVGRQTGVKLTSVQEKFTRILVLGCDNALVPQHKRDKQRFTLRLPKPMSAWLEAHSASHNLASIQESILSILSAAQAGETSTGAQKNQPSDANLTSLLDSQRQHIERLERLVSMQDALISQQNAMLAQLRSVSDPPSGQQVPSFTKPTAPPRRAAR